MTIFDLISDKNYQHKNVLYKIIWHICDIKKDDMIKHYDQTLPQNQIDQIILMYDRYAKEKEPLEYILGYVDFLWYRFTLDNRSLIPRAETEYMIQAVTEYLHNYHTKHTVRDIWCGCGVLWLSVALHNTNLVSSLTLTDSEQECLDLTYINIGIYKDDLTDIHIETLQSDLVDFAKDLTLQDKVILVSNLPYIPDDTFELNADESAKKREPRTAFLWWKDGLDLYRRMFDQLFEHRIDTTMFLEMMTWQVDILEKEYGDKIQFEIVKTFHFNIVIVKGELVN